MATKTIPQLPVASTPVYTDLYHTSQGGVDAQITLDTIASYIMRSSRYAPISVPVTGTTTIAVSPTVQSQIVEATLSGSSYTVTFPGVSASTFPCKVLVMRIGAASQGILSLAGLNNYGGTIRLFNDQDCALVEVVQTGTSTYVWELTAVLTTGSYSPASTPFTSTFGDIAREYPISTGASNFVFNLPALSSSPGKEYIFTKTDTGAGLLQVTPGGSDPIGTYAAGTAFNLATQGSTLHIVNGGTAWTIIARPSRSVITTSGALGTLAVTTDTSYYLSAASTATLPAAPQPGCSLTFKNKGAFTSTISANAGQTIGTTSSTSFVLYAQEDYVTLEWDGSSIWYVKATNGPVQFSDQTATTTCNGSSAWTAIGNGLSLGTLAPGVYDFDMEAALNPSATFGIAIGNGTTPISNKAPALGNATTYGAVCHVRGYVLTASATIQGIYYSGNSANQVYYLSPQVIGRITARRIG